ncbi:MAG: DNA polymerase III subunit gamma/tau [Thermodesulfobacteriota bacterium]
MSYLVLARKWRPQSFEEVIGQHHITRTLQNAIANDRIAHAFLFAGARGVGKTSMARILAKALNCQEGPKPVPCNRCENCREISSGTAMDVLEIDGASNRGINEIRELRENVKYAPAKSASKIFIIDEVHMLTPEAFNALLKTLEEPPPRVIFILATTEPHKIPLTILSRCQRFDFKRIPIKEIFERLTEIVSQEGVEVSDKGLLLMARESKGSLRDAQSLLDQTISFAGREIKDEAVKEILGVIDSAVLFEISAAIARGDTRKCLDIVDNIYTFGHDIRRFCRELLEHLRNLMVVKIGGDPKQLTDLQGKEIEDLVAQSKEFSLEQIHRLFATLLKSEEEISRSFFPKVIMELALVKMATLRPLVPLDEIMDKLDKLESSLRGSSSDMTTGELAGEEGVDSQADVLPASVTKEEEEIHLDSAKEVASKDPGKADLDENWAKLTDYIRAQNPILGSFLRYGRLLRLDDEEIEIGFEKGSFYLEKMSEEDNRKLCEEVCRNFFKKELKVVFKDVTGETRSARAEKGKIEEPTDRERHLKKEAMENPVIQEAVKIFDGTIEKIKTGTGFKS